MIGGLEGYVYCLYFFVHVNLNMNKTIICSAVLGVIGLILIIVSLAGFAFFPPLIRSEVFKNLDLADSDSEGYKNFVSYINPIYLDISSRLSLYFILSSF